MTNQCWHAANKNPSSGSRPHPAVLWIRGSRDGGAACLVRKRWWRWRRASARCGRADSNPRRIADGCWREEDTTTLLLLLLLLPGRRERGSGRKRRISAAVARRRFGHWI